MRPDEDRDVILHPIVVVDAATGARRPTWNVFLGQELRSEHNSEIAGINAALDLASDLQRPAWIYNENYPLKPLTEDDRLIDYVAACKEGHRPVHLRKAGELRSELRNGTLKHYCMSCDVTWAATDREHANLRARLERDEAQRARRRSN